MTLPAASVVIPSFGRSARLVECLGALGRQAFPEPWEVVVVDDGSPEPIDRAIAGRVQELGLEGLGLRGLDLRVIRQENAGPAAARNRGVAEARGDFVAFTDDDCLPDPTWLAGLVGALRTREDALVGGVTFNGLADDFYASMSQLILDLVYEHFNSDPERAYFLASNNLACSRTRFLAVGGFDATFPRAGGEDRDFCDLWRSRGWPISLCPAARVEHRHVQTLRKFVDIHYRYGRGAYLYKERRRMRGSGTMREDLGFHRTLVTRLLPRLRSAPNGRVRLRMLAAVGLWQFANAAGFALEAIGRGSRSVRG